MNPWKCSLLGAFDVLCIRDAFVEGNLRKVIFWRCWFSTYSFFFLLCEILLSKLAPHRANTAWFYVSLECGTQIKLNLFVIKTSQHYFPLEQSIPG